MISDKLTDIFARSLSAVVEVMVTSMKSRNINTILLIVQGRKQSMGKVFCFQATLSKSCSHGSALKKLANVALGVTLLIDYSE